MKDINRKIKIIIMWSVLILIYIFYVLLVEVIFGIGMQNPRNNLKKSLRINNPFYRELNFYKN